MSARVEMKDTGAQFLRHFLYGNGLVEVAGRLPAIAAKRLAVHAMKSTLGQNFPRNFPAVADTQKFRGIGMFPMSFSASEHGSAAHLTTEISGHDVIK